MLRIYLKGRPPIDIDADNYDRKNGRIELVKDEGSMAQSYLQAEEVQAIIPHSLIDQPDD